ESCQANDGGKWNELENILNTQLEVITFISGSSSNGHDSGKISASAPCSVGDASG
ncbi:hypothetical protein MKW92_018755, partial [Papaver armeniacum]